MISRKFVDLFEIKNFVLENFCRASYILVEK